MSVVDRQGWTHRRRMREAEGLGTNDPVRLLALAVISQAVEDAARGHADAMDALPWSDVANIPEEQVRDALLAARARPMQHRHNQRLRGAAAWAGEGAA